MSGPSVHLRADGTPRTALVTGGNRGLGLEICRRLGEIGFRVLLGARDEELGEEAAHELTQHRLDVAFRHLDVSDADSVEALKSSLEADELEVDVLVNNAGIYPTGTLLQGPLEDFRECLEVHFCGPLLLSRLLVPGMSRRHWGRVVNVSSGYGSLTEGLKGPAAYALSKAALNALTVKLASETPSTVKVNAACPGWVRTRMGGPAATDSVEDGADTIVWLATLHDQGPTGGFFRERQLIDW